MWRSNRFGQQSRRFASVEQAADSRPFGKQIAVSVKNAGSLTDTPAKKMQRAGRS
jgi:hypothetical protein